MDKIQIIEKLFLYLLLYSHLLPPLLFIIFTGFYHKKAVKGSWVIAIYGIVYFIFTKIYILYEGYFAEHAYYGKVYSSTYTFLEYLFFALIIYSSVSSSNLRKVILALSVLFVGFQIVSFIAYQFSRLDSLSIAIETILLSIFIILFFYEQSRTNANQFIYSHPAFYFAIGIMIYLGGSFFFNILVHQLTPQEIARYQPLTYLGDIIKNILFSIGIVSLMRNPPKKLNQPSNVPYLDLDMK